MVFVDFDIYKKKFRYVTLIFWYVVNSEDWELLIQVVETLLIEFVETEGSWEELKRLQE